MQMPGGIIHALKAALFGDQSFDAGTPQIPTLTGLERCESKMPPT